MATTTPNYGWDVPTSTDYVKDGATAIETLGDDIDASMFSALAGKKSGLILLQTNTLSGASATSFTNLLSSTYTNYRVVGMLRGSASVTLSARFRENVTDVSTGYYGSGWTVGFAGGSAVTGARNNGADMLLQGVDSRTNGVTSVSFDITRNTGTTGAINGLTSDSNQGNGVFFGYTNIGMSNFTGISIYPASGTITGDVKLYAYQS